MTRKKNIKISPLLDTVAQKISRWGLDKCLEENAKELKELADYFKITSIQAALLAIIIEESYDGRASSSDLANTMSISNIRMMSLNDEIDVLAQKRLIMKGYGENRTLAASRRLFSAIENNRPFEEPKKEGLTTVEILSRIREIMDEALYIRTSAGLIYDDVTEIFSHNIGNEFVRSCLDLGYDDLHKEEAVVLIYVIYRLYFFKDNRFTLDEIVAQSRGDDFDSFVLLDNLKSGKTMLQRTDILTFCFNDGFEDKESVCVPEQTRKKLFKDSDPITSSDEEKIPCDELISWDQIQKKSLYFNSRESEQVTELSRLLYQENFYKVQERLAKKGMRGGFCCLFYGSPGTGKTETVLQLARLTHRDIFIVDMSKIRNKWVGESEKNIKGLFDRYKRIARQSSLCPILLFNEADAVFGKRIEEEGSVDKMNNAVQNIILREMETLNGILIATTNMTMNFDSAFERRFLYKIMFDVPGAEAQSKIWQSLVEGLNKEDAGELASKYSLTGAQIENIARKMDVDYILTGQEADISKISKICQAESLETYKKKERVGFSM